MSGDVGRNVFGVTATRISVGGPNLKSDTEVQPRFGCMSMAAAAKPAAIPIRERTGKVCLPDLKV